MANRTYTGRSAPATCQRCAGPMPEGCRSDAKWCSRPCSRRAADRTYTCRACGVVGQEPARPGDLRIYCPPCRLARDRASVKASKRRARPAPNTHCQYCGVELAPGGKGNRKWCGPVCQGRAWRRNSGLVPVNRGTCVVCAASLADMRANATLCRSRRCIAWERRHPGEPHPCLVERRCAWCAVVIEGRDASGKYCGANCRTTARRSANPDARMETRRRRLRQRNNPASVGVSARDWKRLVQRYRSCCAYCGKYTPRPHVEHVIPLSKGGGHRVGNVVPACPKCNASKGSKLLAAWRYRSPLRNVKKETRAA